MCAVSLFLVLFTTVNDAMSNNDCDMTKTSLMKYWTNDNILAPDGCIDRGKISLLYADHGSQENAFWILPRNGAHRACSKFGSMNCGEQIYNALSITEILPNIATDVAGSTHHGYSDIYGIALSLAIDTGYTGLKDVVNQGVEIYSLNSGIGYYQNLGSKLHVGQDDENAGYEACLELKDNYGASKILIALPGWGRNRERGCNIAMDNNTVTVLSDPWNFDHAVDAIYDALSANPDIDAILITNLEPEPAVHYVLSNSTDYNYNKKIKGVGVFDYTSSILEQISKNLTSFAVSQQPYLQGFLPMYLLGIKAATSNALIEPSIIDSGPQFIDSDEQIELVQCFPEQPYYCDDDEAVSDKLLEGCECIDTKSKKIYLFHHGRFEADDGDDFYSILTSAALQAANDINVTVEVINASIHDFEEIWENTVFNNQMDGIITTIPSVQIGNLIERVVDSKPNIEVFGIAEGSNIYQELDKNLIPEYSYRHTLFIGSNDVLSGYKMAKSLYLNYSITRDEYEIPAILCIDNQNGILASHNERCEGANEYCMKNDIVYTKLVSSDINSVVDTLTNNNVNISLVAIISSGGDNGCLDSQKFLIDNNLNSVQLGCFDASLSALNGLTSENNTGIVDIIFDQQPWLIGYLSVLMMANRLFLDAIPSDFLIETGPKIFSIFDADNIEIKRCEHKYTGYPFCPQLDIKTIIELNVNYPTLSNFSGNIILILFFLSILISLILIILMYIWRKKSMITRSQPLSIIFTICGGNIMMISGLLYIDQSSLNQSICNIPWIIWSFGFTVFFSSYSLRVWKFVKLIEAGLNFKSFSITKQSIFLRLFVVVLIDIIISILAIIITPIKLSTDITRLNELEQGTIKQIQTSQCIYDSSPIWYISFGYKVVILLYVIIIAIRQHILTDKIKRLKYIKFIEGPSIAIGIYFVIISFMIFILFALSLNDFDPSIQWLLCSFLSFLSYITVLFVCMLHRIIYIIKQIYFDKNIASQMSDIQNSPSSSKQSVLNNEYDRIHSDLYVQRAEYLGNQLSDVIESHQFKHDHAAVLAPMLRKLNTKIYTKLQQSNQTIELQQVPSKTKSQET